MATRFFLRFHQFSGESSFSLSYKFHKALSSSRNFAQSNGEPSKRKNSISPRIYTRTGDGGNSSLYTGERRSKSDDIFEALGSLDEVSSHLGVVIAEIGKTEGSRPYGDHLQRIQCLLQDLGSSLATPSSSAREAHIVKTAFDSSIVKELEDWIDEYSKDLRPLENFILPGGNRISAGLHVARSVTRRAERRLATLLLKEKYQSDILMYVNRLSDFLFTIARHAATIDKTEETIYKQPEKYKNDYEKGPDGIWKKKNTKI